MDLKIPICSIQKIVLLKLSISSLTINGILVFVFHLPIGFASTYSMKESLYPFCSYHTWHLAY